DLDHRRAGREGRVREGGRRLDQARSPDYEQELAGLDRADRALDQRGRQRLAEPDDVGPEQALAGAAGRDPLPVRLPALAAFPAGAAAGPPETAVDLEDLARSGQGVEAVDVLGDEREGGRAALDLGERAVAGVGLRLRDLPAAPVVPLPDQPRILRERLG